MVEFDLFDVDVVFMTLHPIVEVIFDLFWFTAREDFNFHK